MAGAGETVSPRGAVGVIVAAPGEGGDGYQVRFPSGLLATLVRQEFGVRSQVHRDELQGAGTTDESRELYRYGIYRCVVASRAYGLDEPGSDVNRRGIYLPPKDLRVYLDPDPRIRVEQA